MGHDHSHTDLLDELLEHLAPVFENAVDGVYVFLDDETAACNDKCAKLWGYKSPAEWAKASPFLDHLVADNDQETVSRHYHDHIANLSGPVRFKFKAKRKDGSTFNCETDMIPLTFAGHAVAYHFVRQAK